MHAQAVDVVGATRADAGWQRDVGEGGTGVCRQAYIPVMAGLVRAIHVVELTNDRRFAEFLPFRLTDLRHLKSASA
jgi:hypothetical protein